MSFLEQFKVARAVYDSLVKEHGDEIMKEIIKELGIKYSELTCGIIDGYTPEWNDGEAGEHRTDIRLDDVDELEDLFEIDEDFEYNNLSRYDSREIQKELTLVDLILTKKYGTNYRFAFIITDGTVEIIHEYYECGY